jgi:hypothetical protein
MQMYSGSFSSGNLFALVSIVFVLLLLADTVLLNLRSIHDWLLFTFSEKVIVSEEDAREMESYLQESEYFNQLSERARERFVNRCFYLIRRMHFSSSENMQLTLKNKTLIASTIVQLTFGLKTYYIHTIHHIRVFQKEILNPRTKQRFYGLMFASGKMYLSWERFEQGIQISNDGINLGIHEATHGLLILLKHHKLNYEEFDTMLNAWYKAAEKHIATDAHSDGFFRKYAAANKDEFFSVLAENFFERPQEFKKQLPALYDEVCVFFFQDPSNASNDFRINTQQQAIAEGRSASLISPVKPLNLVKDKWHWSFTAFILFGYMSYIIGLALKNKLATSFVGLFATYAVCAPLLYLLLKKRFVATGRMGKWNYGILSFFSLSPIAVILVMLLNIAIPVSGIRSEKLAVKKLVEGYGITINQGDLSYLEPSAVFCELKNEESYSISAREVIAHSGKVDSVIIRYHYGITGLKVFEENELLPK